MKLKKTEFLNKLEKIGESRSDFARRCGISRQAITAWINNDRNPKPCNVKIMAEALHCDIEDIAIPTESIETVALHGDKFAREVIGIGNDEQYPESDIEPVLLNFIANQLSEQIGKTNQSEVGRKIGLSASQINRMTHGKADLSLFPISALIRLCPQIINKDVLYRNTEQDEELEKTISNIKLMADKIADINVARTVESMLKGLIK